jgi:hypothetical protein
VERDAKRVADYVEDVAVVRLNGPAHDGMMARQ